MAERVRRGMQTVTNLGQFTRRKIDALLLHIRARPLTDSLLEKALQLLRHLLDHVGEVGELPCDEPDIRVIGHLVL